MALSSTFRQWLLRQQWFTSTLLPAIPRPMRWALRKAYFLPVDFADRVLGRQEAMVPPRMANFTGSADGFRRSGQNLVEQLVRRAGLRRDSRVLDVGCGVGRLAVALSEYLTPAGSYEGLDIVQSGIGWCDSNIAAKYPNFRFTLADVYNEEYRPNGRVRASEYVFPYRNEEFDLVVLTSVFTHMLPGDMSRYVSEISRVLKSRGRCCATYFLINDESRELIATERSSLRFTYRLDSCWLVNPKAPGLSVAYDESYVRELYAALFAESTIYYGGWCGRSPLWSPESGPGDQDLVVATKP